MSLLHGTPRLIRKYDQLKKRSGSLSRFDELLSDELK
jgi:hypothetical protein